MHLRQQLSIVRAWLPLMVVAVTLAALVGYFTSNLQPKVYEARATLIVGQALTAVNPDYNQLLVSQSLSRTYATVTTTRPVLDRVIERLNLSDTPDQLAQRVTASAATDGALLTIAARDGSSARAALLANTVAEELIAVSPAVQGQQTDVLRSVDEDLRAIRDEIEASQLEIDVLSSTENRDVTQETRLRTLQGHIVSLRSTYATLLSFSTNNASNLLSVIEPAVPPTGSASPRPMLNALLAAVVAFLVVSAVAFVIAYLDDAIKDPDQVEEAIGLPTLGGIERMRGTGGRPAIYRLAPLLYPRSTTAEAYRALRTNIEFAAVDTPIRTLLVTSAVPSEGKTVTAANLAVVFAQGGRRVLLVDADLRKPGVHEVFALGNDHGLTDLLRHDGMRLPSIVQLTELANLEVLTTGPHPPNPAELLGSKRMRSLLPSLSEGYDMLIFDSPPLDVFSDAAVLSSFLDGAILVIEVKRGRRAQIRAAREALARANARLIGVVLNGLPQQAPSDYGRYYGAKTDVSTAVTIAPVGGREPSPLDIEPR